MASTIFPRLIVSFYRFDTRHALAEAQRQHARRRAKEMPLKLRVSPLIDGLSHRIIAAIQRQYSNLAALSLHTSLIIAQMIEAPPILHDYVIYCTLKCLMLHLSRASSRHQRL